MHHLLCFGNNGSDFEGRTFVPGTYTLTATPYSEKRLQGTQGEALTISFTLFSDNDLPVISGATLIKADTDQNPDIEIRELIDNDVIDLALEGGLISIQAQSDMTKTESVKFILKDGLGKTLINRVENLLPYALLGDNMAGDFEGFSPTNGSYELTMIPYTEDRAKGDAGKPKIINFIVQNSLSKHKNHIPMLGDETITSIEKLAEATLVFPNPIHDNNFRIQFSQSLNSEVNYKVYDVQGKELFKGNKTVVGKWLEVQFHNITLNNGKYFLQVLGKEVKPTHIQFVKE